MNKPLIEYIHQAESNHTALGHFNISNLEALQGIIQAASKLHLPIVIGVSEGEREFIGVPHVKALIDSFRKSTSIPIFLNADHTYTLEKIKLVVEAGFDSVIIDGAKLSLPQNIDLTKQVVNYVRSTNPDILVEAELGYIGTSSQLLDEIPPGATQAQESMPTADQARDFVHQTGVDLLSPAVGNIHGMLKHAANPHLNIDRIHQIRQGGGVPLVLHGGSGISDADFTAAISAGISMIHVNTEIRLAYKNSLSQSLQDNPNEVAPYKILKPTIAAVEHVVSARLQLFNSTTH